MKMIVLAAGLLVALGAHAQKTTNVNGHFKSNGTYVQPHTKTSPNSTTSDNYSTKGNYNPYTGKEGKK